MAKMLLPSALIDTPLNSHQPRLFSPPSSPPTRSRANLNITSACRSLQSLMATGVARPTLAISTATAFDFSSSNYTCNNVSSQLQEADALPPMPRTVSAQLPTPPMAYAPPPPKLRIRSEGLAARRLAKRQQQQEQLSVQPLSSSPKRARDEDDEDVEEPTTPKRARIAPEQLPLGLERSDFHDAQDGTDTDASDEWTDEDDRILVEIVLEKLKLTKNEWAECARSVGKGDKHDVAKRWKSLILGGDVGIKKRTRSRITSTWR